MIERVEKLIRERNMLPRGCTVLCAVSGGADSVCLLHLLYRLRPRLGFHLAAAHFNHRLRGEESERDAAFVEQLVALCCGAEHLAGGGELPAVPLYTGGGDVAARAEERGTGLEETARELRYAFLRETAKKIGADRIATAHNAGDNVETILFHLARGSGLRGLAGIHPARDGLIRPLLTVSREEIEKYLAYYGLPHVEDSSNAQDRYSRNRIRHQVVPVLEELYPGFSARMADTAARLRADEDCLEELAGEISAQASEQGEALSLPAALIGGAPGPLAVRAVRQLMGRLRGGDQNCSAAHLEGVVRLCRETDPSARLDLPGGITARREYETLILSRESGEVPLEETPLALPGETAAGPWRVSCTGEDYAGQPQGDWEFWLDWEMVSGLTLRPRRRGDRLKPAGRPGKLVKKWMIDEKIPRKIRDCLPILDCGGAVAAAAGLGPDETFAARTERPAWHITVQKNTGYGKEETADA